jgi:hypothetical protein
MDLKVYIWTFSRIWMWHCSAYRQWISSKHSMLFIFYMLFWYDKIYVCWVHILGTFANLQKVAVSFMMSVCLPANMEQLGLHWTDFHKIWYLSIFKKFVQKMKISLKCDNRYFTWRPTYIDDHISLNYSYNEKCFREKL